MTTIDVAIDALTAEVTQHLNVTLALRSGVSKQIADAVDVSTNAALIPLVTVATNLIDMQTLLVTYITTR